MLSQQSRYALKALIDLAAAGDAAPQPVAAIAARTGTPRKFLEAILGQLRQAGFVVATRGARGGYRLARPAAAIGFGEVIRAIEGPLAPIACASQRFYRRCADCPDAAACALRRVMVEARDGIAAVLDGRSLADAVGVSGSGNFVIASEAKQSSPSP